MKLKILFVMLGFLPLNCAKSVSEKAVQPVDIPSAVDIDGTLVLGAARMDAYLPDLQKAKGVGLVVNPTSTVGRTHLVDTLLAQGVNVRQIFAPEHGFRGTADAGETVTDGKDKQTGLPIMSLYGDNKKPKPSQLQGLDVVVFDIQDVGVRFYTYISTLHYVMEACAEQGIKVLVLDRPNPNGHYVDGPILDPDFKSFVGMHRVPIVHGMTVAEYAKMVNGEGWLKGGIKCELEVVPCLNYTHSTPYELPVKPSPNLPNNRSIYLYPSLCFFEGTVVSVGRGTNTQFQVYGHPDATIGDYYFTPEPMPGAKYPKLEGKRCRGFSLATTAPEHIRQQGYLNLDYLVDFYQAYPNKANFFLETLFIDKLAGTDALRKAIIAGQSAEEIRASWAEGLTAYREMREGYLLYP
ncbi:exo-beta-N-acetylmuramidase NamZ family protein [Phaeodactylibacter xiamenensis]|uniref:exo-beta-N-acetylmuramidase NamZ family protein n=1 Tax=Phaeodactylibacter xiamenensis TaxID=1524460 RepID=UPI003CCB8934